MIERSLAFGPANGLVGTVCLPAPEVADSGPVGVVTFNAGVVHRIGPHRINVRLARRLAAKGIPSIRFDLSGQGDSARADGGLGFEQQAVADLRTAMDCLATQSGARRFALFGFCSGGCHSFNAAQADERIAGVILYDTFIYPTAWSRPHRYLLKLRHRGPANAIAGWLRRQARAFRAGYGQATKASGMNAFPTPPPEEFARLVKQLHARGTRVAMMYSGAFEEYNYAGQFEDRFRPLGLEGLVRCDYLPAMGHTASVMASQDEFLGRIEEFVASLPSGTGTSSTRAT